MDQIGLLDILRLANFTPGSSDRIVRHQHAKYPAAQVLERNLMELFQAYQSRPVFHKARHVISFYGVDGTRAAFFGVFQKMSVRGARDGESLVADPWAMEWRRVSKYFYTLKRLRRFDYLQDRLIIEWGPAALAWCQRPSDKPVLELRPPGRALAPFQDYLGFSISFAELTRLFGNEDAHPEWRAQLSAVAGIYLILAEPSGKLYIGSATGAEGIWGRWRAYARTKHGGNQLLKQLIASDERYPTGFRFSILQILPKSMTREDVIAYESAFKAKLGSQAHGLNMN